MSLATFFDRYLPPLETEMRAIVRTADPRYAGLFGMLRYHMGWADAAFNPCQARTGKRVRPVLCLLACETCGGSWEQALPAAAAIELLHNFSLIHDDIEDRDETRRGRLTVWALWGDAQAINAGDALLALANLALLRLSERKVPATTVVAAIRLFNHACLALTGGQYLDIGFESQESVSIADYLVMVEGKTAALVACACEMGALIAAASDTQRKHLRSFGHHLGLAFQMRDDILGIWGDPNATGKPVGADIARRKKSLPILHGLERSAELRALLAQKTLSAADIHRAVELLGETNSREYAEQLAREHHTRALAALVEANPQGPAAQALHELAQTLLNRER
ncbi:MAG: polyprenyl synthetase family protein [Chloroflexi bacterium]|nr:MAG: polyprenyl synthetase family protein [Chloroflexota bacterium]